MFSRKLLTSCFAAALFIGVTSTPSQAQQNNGQATFGNLIAALNNINVQVDDLIDIGDVNIGDITLVNVEDVLNGNNVRALNRALNRNNVEILNLRDVLNDSEILTDFLNDNNVLIDEVIAIDVLSGDLVIFVLPLPLP